MTRTRRPATPLGTHNDSRGREAGSGGVLVLRRKPMRSLHFGLRVADLEIDSARLETEVRVECPPDSEQAFPHIHGPLPVKAVVQVREVPVGDHGRLTVNALLGGG
jgi:hypothetical protein